ncbi:MAG: exodeoxyribonuclease VII small subunit [Bacteroidota bacterium]|nr:exodeoxyribonuclease VII small subunit [Bacteroidota bacterium]
MENKENYQEAFQELNEIVEEIEAGEISVDELSTKVKRAAELIRICKKKLTTTEEDVNKILQELQERKWINAIKSAIMETKIRLIPEWEEPRAVAFVWPEHLPAETGKLKNFFIDLVRIVSQITRVLIVFKTESDQEKINKSLKNSENIELIHQPDVSDIWIRDYGPLAIIEGERRLGSNYIITRLTMKQEKKAGLQKIIKLALHCQKTFTSKPEN